MDTKKAPRIETIHPDALPQALVLGLRWGHATSIFDVRMEGGFERRPFSITEAIPVTLKDHSWLLPDLDRQQALLVLTDSERPELSRLYAEALLVSGYCHVWVLEGGLDGWMARHRAVPLAPEAQARIKGWIPSTMNPQAASL